MCDKQACSHGKYGETGSFSLPTKQTSMCSLIIWNISKALENNPSIDLTRAIRSAHERLEHESRDESRMISQAPGDRHLTCALLAWHQLGHTDVEGLCKFIEENRNKPVRSASEKSPKNCNIEKVNKPDVYAKAIKIEHKCSENIKDVDSQIFDTQSLMGPVVKLPVETIVMRCTPPPPCQHHLKKPQKTQTDAKPLKCQNNLKNKIDALVENKKPKWLPKDLRCLKKLDNKSRRRPWDIQHIKACCIDSACIKRLSELDTAVKELRTRATKLARREAERVEVLERAEAAWKDLEMGFQRRLTLAVEKENDITKQIKKMIEERNSYKNISTNLAETLKERGDAAQKERERLRVLEKEVCDRACVRLQLSEESAKGDAALAEQLCRASQLDRDLQLKEAQARRKETNLQSELDSSQCLTYETERALRLELSALKGQITEVSKELLAEEDNNNSIKAELHHYRQEKADILEDLDGCKDFCESRMKARVDDLNQNRDQLRELKERAMECQCKLPIDVAVEVKRTPSLAALCHCTPDDKLLESCSCTSLRSRLLSDLLADLFGGLQAELGATGSFMPCGLLLCLDDRHNWDRASAVKSSLRNFFAQLLVGELDIAIATSIEKYHAKWVGASCADKAKLTPDPGEDENEGWEQRAIERRAQKLATKLAEQLFEDRAEELKQKAKDIVLSGPPPCECDGPKRTPAVFPCLVKTPVTNAANRNEVTPSYMRRTIQDVTSLKHQIQDLKKESIKKEDLRQMEEKITKIIRRASKIDGIPTTSKTVKCVKNNQELIEGKKKTCEDNNKNNEALCCVTRKEMDESHLKKNVKKCSNNQIGRIDKKTNQVLKKLEQSFAVNLCLCSGQEAPAQQKRSINLKASWKQKKSRDLITNVSNVKQSKPISTLNVKEENNQSSKVLTKTICQSNCICFHKMPSNTSIDKLLETLSKWNGSLNEITEYTKVSDTEVDIENTCLKESLISENLKNDKTGNDESLKSLDHTDKSFQFITDSYNKDTACNNILPSSTESEYIGAINLDKSNYNICRCPKSGKTMPGDEPLHCINADVCKCKSSVLSRPTQDSKLNKFVPSNINNASQVYAVEVDKPQFKYMETNTESLNKNNSRNGNEIREDTFIHDLVRKSQLFPNTCDYLVKFLGVTLTNAASENKSKQDNDKDTLHISSKELNNEGKHTAKELSLNVNMKDKKNLDLFTLDNSEDKEFNLGDISENNKIQSDFSDRYKDVCVCCDNSETSNDLELNAFNLLEEHIKEKLGEFLHSSCTSSCIPTEEEKELFSMMMVKVKEVISDSTKGLSCICSEKSANKGSWSRAYGMLQEYLKVKIKRVQCSCISSEKNLESVLPSISKKIWDSIENDFQRLRKKCKCVKDDKNDIKNPDHLNTISFGLTNSKTIIKKENEENKMASRTRLDKSCEVLDSAFPNLSTSEKEVSCEFKIFDIDCQCKHKLAEPSDMDKDFIVNQSTVVISKDILSQAETNDTKISSLEVKKGKPSTENNEENLCFLDCDTIKQEPKDNIPYIGYTLSCKSLVRNNTERIDDIWKSVTDETHPTKCSYIMQKVLPNEKSENNINTLYSNSKSCLNDLQRRRSSVKSVKKDICDIDVSAFDSEEDIVLKYSSDNFYETKDNMRTFDERSTCMKSNNNDNSSCMHECGTEQYINNKYIDKFDKSFLYDSLHLPTDFTNLDASENLIDINDRSELEEEKCDCEMVPICHVKMLVNNIEKKLIHSKCTCDSLTSQVCPVHS